MNGGSITRRFIVWFLLISLLPITLIGYSLLHIFETELKQTIARQISAIADKKADQIDEYLNERVRDVLLKAQESSTRQAMREFVQVFARSGVESAAYRRLDASYRDYFRRFVAGAGYYDLFLISPQGAVVYSHAREADFATNLVTGPYRNTGLARATRNALNTLESGMSEFELYAPSGNAMAAFIAVPIVIHGKLEGVLATQIDNNRVFQVLLDETGLGISGETVVARLEGEHTALVVAPLKSDPDAALKRRISLSDRQRATPLARALNGERGSGFETDYTGRPVAAAWRFLPRMNWGMVVKMETSEVMAPLYRVRNFALGMIGLALFAALVGAFLLARRVVTPLRHLTDSAREIAAGKFDQRVPVAGRDELGQLGASFNTMAEHLHTLYGNLEDQVTQRTAELTQGLASLHIRDVAMASSMSAVAMAGLDGKLFYVNQAFVKLWRLQGPQDAIGRSPFEFWDKPEDAQAVMDVLQRQGHWQGELRARLHDGCVADVELHATRVVDAAGQPVCTMGWFVDVTARNQMARSLQQERDFASSLLNTAPVIVLLLDPQGMIQHVNPYFERLTGYRLDEIKGREWFRTFLPARDRDTIRDLFQKSVHGVPTRGNVNPIVTRNGEEREIEWYDQPMRDAQGAVTGVLAIGQDVTERRLTEQSLETSAQRLNDAQRIAQVGNWELDLVNNTLAWSDEVFRLFEIDQTAFDATYDAFLNAIHPDDRDAVNQAYVHSLSARAPYEITHRLRMGDGRIKWVQERCTSDFDAAGKPLRSIGTIQDITRIKLAEIELQQLNEQLEERVESRTADLTLARREAELASHAKTEFLSRMSHELRTPLNAVIGFGQLLESDPDHPLTEMQRGNVGEILQAGQHLLELINEVLDMSRIESGQLEIKLQAISIAPAIEACVKQVQPLAAQRGITMALEVDAAAVVQADQLRLKEVLLNLLSNAVKYNREGGDIRVDCAPAGQGRLRVNVRDSGRGIAASALARLFKPFERLESSYDGIEGTGIGLALSKKLVEAMHGTIGVESVPGKGSTFWFELPLAAADKAIALNKEYKED